MCVCVCACVCVCLCVCVFVCVCFLCVCACVWFSSPSFSSERHRCAPGNRNPDTSRPVVSTATSSCGIQTKAVPPASSLDPTQARPSLPCSGLQTADDCSLLATMAPLGYVHTCVPVYLCSCLYVGPCFHTRSCRYRWMLVHGRLCVIVSSTCCACVSDVADQAAVALCCPGVMRDSSGSGVEHRDGGCVEGFRRHHLRGL